MASYGLALAELSSTLFSSFYRDPAEKITATKSIVEKSDLTTTNVGLRHNNKNIKMEKSIS